MNDVFVERVNINPRKKNPGSSWDPNPRLNTSQTLLTLTLSDPRQRSGRNTGMPARGG